MKIISLEVEAFKRLKAVSITPTGNIVEVTGNNENGKSSVLDSIWAALGGKDAVPAKPIHTGAEEAVIRLDLGELKVTRRFKLKDGAPFTTDLVVESAEGARFTGPQGILDALVGELCFDPLAFTRLKAAEQFAELRKFVPGVDFVQLEGLNKADYDKRTDLNRRAKDFRAQVGTLPTSDEEPVLVDEDAIMAKLTGAAAASQVRARRQAARDRITTLQAQIAEAQRTIDQITEELAAGSEPEEIDTTAVQAELTQAKQANALAQNIMRRRAVEAQATDAEAQAEELTAAIAKRTADAKAAVAAAKMPVDGLGFGDGFITLNDEPFDQASQAQKIKASVAIAAAMNPRLRVAMIKDGSLLDKTSWAALQAFADASDMQVWVESVTPNTAAAILIEDGSVSQVEQIGDVV